MSAIDQEALKSVVEKVLSDLGRIAPAPAAPTPSAAPSQGTNSPPEKESSTAATVVVPFDYGIAVGDNFLRAPLAPMQTATAQLTSNLAEVDASIAVGTGGAFRTLKIIGCDLGGEGRSMSKAWLYFGDHFLNSNP